MDQNHATSVLSSPVRLIENINVSWAGKSIVQITHHRNAIKTSVAWAFSA